ncbi:MAG: ACP S-malonyltransferase [Clostridia bacterium]|nr:ACP S-malonyltransferase [Clostridia bacterium]
MKIAFMFPGQGAQKTGMGEDLYNTYEQAKRIYDLASKILGIDVAKMSFSLEQEELNKTENTQIAILVNSLAILEILKSYDIKAQALTGLSLGEYTALIYSGYIKLEDGIRLIQKRGYYMGNYIPQGEYKMAAIMGLESSKIEAVCESMQKQGKFVVPANYNYSNQTVISGDKEAVEVAIEKLKQEGAKKIVELKTSGPFHTKKLIKAKELFEKELEKIDFQQGSIAVIKNIDGTLYKDTDNIKQILANHIISPVRFDKTIKKMQDENIDIYIEIGAGKALTGFIKKEIKEARVVNISDVETLKKALEEIKN